MHPPSAPASRRVTVDVYRRRARPGKPSQTLHRKVWPVEPQPHYGAAQRSRSSHHAKCSNPRFARGTLRRGVGLTAAPGWRRARGLRPCRLRPPVSLRSTGCSVPRRYTGTALLMIRAAARIIYRFHSGAQRGGRGLCPRPS
ncbi:hypothetical protein [Desulfotomaculum nigrificans]|uniref:hypothetical protein n=1 Tax=Desulfotomaculum nigrificans TaxID=1565 RepID=UPI0012DE72DB|nr:hypothetical protein [Desulfotomaculum nigrificans]